MSVTVVPLILTTPNFLAQRVESSNHSNSIVYSLVVRNTFTHTVISIQNHSKYPLPFLIEFRFRILYCRTLSFCISLTSATPFPSIFYSFMLLVGESMDKLSCLRKWFQTLWWLGTHIIWSEKWIFVCLFWRKVYNSQYPN